MRNKIIAGNWKMNLDYWESQELIEQLLNKTETSFLPNIEVIIAPAFPFLHFAYETTKDTKIQVAAQNMAETSNGARTGEVSARMLSSAGIKQVILGHSERRQFFNENDSIVKTKTKLALINGFRVFLCVGESLNDRKSDRQNQIVRNQILDTLEGLSKEELSQIVIAYEPIWAIGTGETATPNQVQKMHELIRLVIQEKFGLNIAKSIQIIYGGSVKPENSKEIFSQKDVDGGLIGGSSLKCKEFWTIIKSALPQ